jgi:hypothetical protein
VTDLVESIWSTIYGSLGLGDAEVYWDYADTSLSCIRYEVEETGSI